MKYIVVFVALFAMALAAPDGHDYIVHQEQEVDHKGFKFEVETSDGTSHKAHGEVKDAGSEHEALAVEGHYEWVDKKGEKFSVSYTADEHGYQPQVSYGS